MHVNTGMAGIRLNSNQGRAGNGYQSVATHVCFAFNTDKGCCWQRCRFSHRCKRCNLEGHRVTTCSVVRANNNSSRLRAVNHSAVRSVVRNSSRNFSSPLSGHNVSLFNEPFAQQASSRVAMKSSDEQKGAAQSMQGNFCASNAS